MADHFFCWSFMPSSYLIKRWLDTVITAHWLPSLLLNTFQSAMHLAYLCLKVSTSLGVISVHDSQKDARNIEQGFALSHKNVHFLRGAEDKGQQITCTLKAEACSRGKTAIWGWMQHRASHAISNSTRKFCIGSIRPFIRRGSIAAIISGQE
jgi:hypothetical protein